MKKLLSLVLASLMLLSLLPFAVFTASADTEMPDVPAEAITSPLNFSLRAKTPGSTVDQKTDTQLVITVDLGKNATQYGISDLQVTLTAPVGFSLIKAVCNETVCGGLVDASDFGSTPLTLSAHSGPCPDPAGYSAKEWADAGLTCTATGTLYTLTYAIDWNAVEEGKNVFSFVKKSAEMSFAATNYEKVTYDTYFADLTVTPVKDGMATKASGTTGGLTWTLLNNGSLSITGTGALPDYGSSAHIPWYEYRNFVKTLSFGENVTGIGSYAFSGCTGLTSVTVGAGITKIGAWAFENCASLASVTIGADVTAIGEEAFCFCAALDSITVDPANTVYRSAGNCLIKTAGKTLIRGCRSSVIPTDGSVTAIGSSAFSGCTSLTSITIPDGIKSIGNYAFEYCDKLTRVKIPGSVKSIGDEAFGYCTDLVSILVPNSVAGIGNDAFCDCPSLKIFGSEASYAKTYTGENGVPYVVVGDVNRDGAVTSHDRLLLSRHLAGWDLEPGAVDLDAADVNLDGALNPSDRATIARFIAEWDGYGVYFGQ